MGYTRWPGKWFWKRWSKLVPMDSSLYGTFWLIYPKQPWFFSGSRMDPQNEPPSNIHLLPNRATNNSSLGIQGGSFRWNLHMVPKPAVSESAPRNGSIGIFNILPNFAPAIHALHNSYPCLLQKISEDLLICAMNPMKAFKFWTISWVTTVNRHRRKCF